MSQFCRNPVPTTPVRFAVKTTSYYGDDGLLGALLNWQEYVQKDKFC